MMYIDNEVLEKMIMTIVEGFDRIEKKLDRMNRLKDCMDGDTLMDNCDLAQLLGVTQRTIARYREKGLIRYYQTDENGKNYYRSSEIQEFLRQMEKIMRIAPCCLIQIAPFASVRLPPYVSTKLTP